MAGKDNESSSQLSRISANQMSYIEIIRGTSNDLDVRSAGPVVNIVLLEAESRSSLTAELNVEIENSCSGNGRKVSLKIRRTF